MKQDLLNNFEKARDLIIDSVFNYVKDSKNQTIELNNRPDHQINDAEYIVTQIYKKMFIDNNTLYIEYEYGDGFEPYEYETETEELWVLSANEIYEIIQRIKE